MDATPPEVSFEGIVQERRSESQAGSLELLMDDGSSVLLESDTLLLSPFLDQRVQAWGTFSSTSDGGGLLQVRDILSLEQSVSSEAFTEERSSSLPPILFSRSSAPASSRSSANAPALTRPSSSSSSRGQVLSSARSSALLGNEEKIKKMAQDKGPDAWTQSYCSEHVGLRFPVRRDWWYRSFGATPLFAWHVEIGVAEIENQGDGLLAVNILSSRLPDGIADGSVLSSGGNATGYRSWTNGRHVEVTGPVELRASVEYITGHIGVCDAAASAG